MRHGWLAALGSFVLVLGVQACSGGGDSTAPTGGCPDGQKSCDGQCVALSLDPANCGACGNACAGGQVCSAGTCAESCGGGTTECSGGVCVDTLLDRNNCGACGSACPEGQVCSAGACGLECVGGTAKCGDKCADTLLDPAHCGACDNACASGEVCSAGACGLECVGGSTNCNGKCADTQLDPANCGTCGNACSSGEVCSGGGCGLSCGSGTTNCTGKCVDTLLDPANCGGCANACPNGQVCTAGVCGLKCVGGTTSCNGKCVDTQIDAQNCGGCGTVCQGNTVCSGGTCKAGCSPPTVDCNGTCTNTQFDPKNCGTCGNACGAGQACSDGLCKDVASVDCNQPGACTALVIQGGGSTEIDKYLKQWGWKTVTVAGTSLTNGYDYSPYQVVAVTQCSSCVADPAYLAAQNAAGGPGITFHSTYNMYDKFDMGAGSGGWQSGGFQVAQNGHYITSGYGIGALDLSFDYKSVLVGPTANTAVLGSCSGGQNNGPGLVVHKQYRRVMMPYYGHTSGMPWSTAGEEISRRAFNWAAGMGAQ